MGYTASRWPGQTPRHRLEPGLQCEPSVPPPLANARSTDTKRPRIWGAALALVALAISALALTSSVGAEGDLPGIAGNNYDAPPPCGPGAGDAFQPEPHEVTSGHFALFDAYWQDTTDTESTDGDAGSGVLHTNLCPPKVTTTTQESEDEEEEDTTVTTLNESNIDIAEAIFHVKNEHKATAVATSAQIAAGKISLEEYAELDDFVDAGDTVWWLQLDDPDTAADETSDLRLGFSTRHLSDQDWAAADGDPPLRYRLAVERYPGHPSDHPHFLAYHAPKDNNATHAEDEVVWSSAQAGVSVLKLEPGVEITDLQWIFTDPGTYEIWVELVGYVRQTAKSDAPTDWAAISGNVTETSEVKRYVIHVGDELNEEEPPLFGLNLTVPEHSAPGTAVSDPLPILQAEAETLAYTLTGEGSRHFRLAVTTSPHTVQIVVAEGANLDFETKPSYDLTLSVTDNVDHESNPDLSIDDVLGIRIALEDVPPTVVLQVDDPNPAAGDLVTFSAVITDFGDGRTLFYEYASKKRRGIPTGTPTYSISHDAAFTDIVTLTVSYHTIPGDPDSEVFELTAAPLSVTWSAP